MNDQSAFWQSPRSWPVTMPGYVFLAHAVNCLGKARYPISWSGDEPWIDVIPPLPDDQGKAGNDQLRRARRLLNLPQKEIAVPILRPGGKPTTIPHRLADDEWAQARLASLEIAVPTAEKSARWNDILEITCGLFRVGGLHCYLRPVQGGPNVGPTKPELWNAENTIARFGRCQIDLSNPYGQTAYQASPNVRDRAAWGQNFHYIFVEDRSLSESIAAIGKLSPPPFADPAPKANKPGNKAYDDSAIVDEMLALVQGPKQLKAHAAAAILAPNAQGAGSLQSKQTRIAKAFKAKYPALVSSRVRD